MKVLKIDIDKTNEVYEKAKHLLKQGECYGNCIQTLALVLRQEYQENKYKIGYCYVGGEDQLLVRHCVIVAKNNKVIDISSMLKYDIIELEMVSKAKDVKYYVFAELDSMQLFFALEKDDNMVGLKNSLKDMEREFYKYTQQHHLYINEIDYNEYIKDLIDS